MIYATRFVKCLLSAVCLWCGGGVFVVAQASGEAPIIVVYSDATSPFRGAIDQMVQGVQMQAKRPVVALVVTEQGDAAEAVRVLAPYKSGVVLALGARGIEAVRQANSELPRVLTGVSFPELSVGSKGAHVTALGLEPDPQLFFERLRRWTPGVRRVVVVWHVDTPAWYLQRAKEAARQYSLELALVMVADPTAAVREYRTILATLNPEAEALWLAQDPRIFDERGVLMVLQVAWERKLVVFTANANYVRRGALFGILPSYQKLGRALALLAEARLDAPDAPDSGAPLKDVVIAVNVRTAAHLGLDRNVRQQAGYDLVFPAP